MSDRYMVAAAAVVSTSLAFGAAPTTEVGWTWLLHGGLRAQYAQPVAGLLACFLEGHGLAQRRDRARCVLHPIHRNRQAHPHLAGSLEAALVESLLQHLARFRPALVVSIHGAQLVVVVALVGHGGELLQGGFRLRGLTRVDPGIG